MRVPGQPGHAGDRGHPDRHGHQLQHGLQAVAEAAPAKPGGLQLPLFVQVPGLQRDEPGLSVQEGFGLGVQRLAAVGRAAEGHGERRRSAPAQRLFGRRFGLFAKLDHLVRRE